MRFTKIVLAVSIAVTGVAGGIVVAQRSGGPSGVAPASPMAASGLVRAAAETTKKTGSSRVSMDMRMGMMGEVVTMHGEGLMDYLAQAGSLTFTMKGAELPAGLGVGFQIMFAEGVVYMRAPIPGMFGPKPWVKMDLSDLAGEKGPGGLGMQNPADMLSFTKHAGDVRAAGTARVRGVPTTRYTMMLDAGKALSEANPSLGEMFDGVTLGAMPAELWVDDKGLVRRFSLDMGEMFKAIAQELDEPGEEGLDSGRAVDMRITMEFFDFGTPVEVEVPDPSEVGEMPAELFGEGSETAGA